MDGIGGRRVNESSGGGERSAIGFIQGFRCDRRREDEREQEKTERDTEAGSDNCAKQKNRKPAPQSPHHHFTFDPRCRAGLKRSILAALPSHHREFHSHFINVA
jgi:hypothetical protein